MPNLPVFVKKIKLGGLKGYSAGNRILPWYIPPDNKRKWRLSDDKFEVCAWCRFDDVRDKKTLPSKSVPAGPRIEKCHSNTLSSRGAAEYREEGFFANDLTSAMILLMALLLTFMVAGLRLLPR